MKKNLFISIALLLSIGIVAVAFFLSQKEEKKHIDTKQLEITMLNVGQGDALYIRTPEGKDILIDGGPNRKLLWELGESMPPFDHTIEYVIATHPDADHIAGLAELPEMYDIDTLITNGDSKDSSFSHALDQWTMHAQIMTAQRGQRLNVEQDMWIEFIHPDAIDKDDTDYNNDALVFILHYKEFEALFTGDIEKEVETELVQTYGKQLDVDLLKVAHHGSKTSTTQELLNVTTPDIALISAGKDNRYGHPNPGVLWRLQQMDIQIFRTDNQGRIECTTDGVSISCLY